MSGNRSQPIAWLVIPIAIVWASPWTMLGVFLGLAGMFTGGGVQRVGRVLEFHGGLLAWLLRKAPITNGASAMTLGHVVIARTEADLDRTRTHELVHVRQYERWGILFVPAYFAASALAWIRGGNPYYDNAFEQEAFGAATRPAPRILWWFGLNLLSLILGLILLLNRAEHLGEFVPFAPQVRFELSVALTVCAMAIWINGRFLNALVVGAVVCLTVV